MKIPKNHKTFVTITNKNKVYEITAPEKDRSTYTLWLRKDKEYELIARSNNPIKLEKKIGLRP